MDPEEGGMKSWSSLAQGVGFSRALESTPGAAEQVWYPAREGQIQISVGLR